LGLAAREGENVKIERARLGDMFYNQAFKNAKQTVTTKQMKEIFFDTDGRILTCGHFLNLGYRKLCPGIYELFLKPDDEPICQSKSMGVNSRTIFEALKP
jgi:hypothetical protein